MLFLLPALTVKHDTVEFWLDVRWSVDCRKLPFVTFVRFANTRESAVLFIMVPIELPDENSSCAPFEPMYSILLQKSVCDPFTEQLNTILSPGQAIVPTLKLDAVSTT